MKFICLILIVVLILVSGCVKTPTANVVIEDVEPEEELVEIQPEEEIEEAVEEKPEEAVEEPEEVPDEKPAEEEAKPKEKIEVIKIKDKKFIPDKLTVDKGTTIVWEHNEC